MLTVKDFQDRDDYILVQTDHAVKAVLESIGMPEAWPEFDHLLVKVGEGEFEEVYGIDGIPYLWKEAVKLYPED